MDTALAVAVA